MGGWYLRMAEAVEACMSSCTQPERPHRPYWQLQWVSRVRPELCGLVRPKMQLKARPNIQPQGHGFESRLCHTELTSGKNGVGQNWWGTCPGYVPQCTVGLNLWACVTKGSKLKNIKFNLCNHVIHEEKQQFFYFLDIVSDILWLLWFMNEAKWFGGWWKHEIYIYNHNFDLFFQPQFLFSLCLNYSINLKTNLSS